MTRIHETLERRPVSALLPYARNARTHSADQVAQIAASIREFGFTNPVLIDEDGGIIAGHGRVMAARELGMPEVPCLLLTGLTEVQRRAYVLADNQLALNAGWDEALLASELASLVDAEFDLMLLGFSASELDDFLQQQELGSDDEDCEDAVPAPPVVPITQPGDVWILGPHRVLNGDARDPASYPALMGGRPAAMCFTDPPYNVNYANSPTDKRCGRDRPILNDHLGTDFHAFLVAALTPTLQQCTGAVYVAMSSSELATLQTAFRQAGGDWSTFIIWAKHTFTLGRSDYQRQYEPILYGWPEGSTRHWCGDRDQSDVWAFKKPARNDLHPTMKPVELVERAIRNSSRVGDSVLDPFGGSGTTLIAAERARRSARLIELDPKYVDVIVRRWQDQTGKRATREADGVAFDAPQGCVS